MIKSMRLTRRHTDATIYYTSVHTGACGRDAQESGHVLAATRVKPKADKAYPACFSTFCPGSPPRAVPAPHFVFVVGYGEG